MNNTETGFDFFAKVVVKSFSLTSVSLEHSGLKEAAGLLRGHASFFITLRASSKHKGTMACMAGVLTQRALSCPVVFLCLPAY